MGFSVPGFLIAFTVLAPSLLFLVVPPRDGPVPEADTGRLLAVLETVGQVACLVVTGASRSKFDGLPVDGWAVLMAGCIGAYYALWIRYLVGGRSVTDLYRSLGPIPVPMAVFPVLAFGSAALWSRSVWIGAAAAVLAVGHVTNSWRRATVLDRRSISGQ